MKALILAVAIALLAGCTSRTEFGDCIGLADEKDPALVYRLSAWNLVLGVVFFQTIVVPVMVAVEQTYCPTAKRVKQ
jgi:hypothetical protein